MSQEILDVLMRSTPAEARQRLNISARDLDAQVLQLTASLNGELESPERKAVVAYVDARIDEPFEEGGERIPPLNLTPEVEGLRQWACSHYRAVSQQYLTPELLERERRAINEEEILAGLREIEATGGLELKDFIHELEEEARPRE
jgi:hypothetical protein